MQADRHLVGIADGDLLLELDQFEVLGADLDLHPIIIRPDHRDDLLRGVDGLHGADNGDDARVGLDLGRLSASGINEDE